KLLNTRTTILVTCSITIRNVLILKLNSCSVKPILVLLLFLMVVGLEILLKPLMATLLAVWTPILLMLLSFPPKRQPMLLLTTSNLIGLKLMGLNPNLLTLMFVTTINPTLLFLFHLLAQMMKTFFPSLVRQKPN